MRRSLVLACFLAAGCGPRVQLFGAADAGCLPCIDAGAPRDAAPLPIGEPRFEEAGSDDDFRALAAALAGDYKGVSVRDGRATRFEVHFTPSAERTGRGRFRLRCLDRPECDPFGPGSAEPRDEGGYDLVQLDAAQRGQGELSWRGMPQAEFWNMTREPDALSFLVGYPAASKEAGAFASLALVRGEWPDAGEPFHVENDAGSDAASPEGGMP